jgi:hypothetical protein
VTLGIMQPYFLPYIGYWQLLAAVDRFVIYDNIKYTKKGWINRNRFLRDGSDVFFTLPLKKGSDFLNIDQRAIADDFDPDSLLKPIESAYRKAPHFASAFAVFEAIVRSTPRNLFEFLHNGLRLTAEYLEIKTPIVVSSSVAIDHELKGEDKVIALCGALGATRYVNFIGGREMYAVEHFNAAGIDLKFIRSRPIEYPQFDRPFVPSLSILDVMMFNSRDTVRGMVGAYDLV